MITVVESHTWPCDHKWTEKIVPLGCEKEANRARTAAGVDSLVVIVVCFSENAASPRTELLHNIDPLSSKWGPPLEGSPFDVRVRAAIRVGDYKLITGKPSKFC